MFERIAELALRRTRLLLVLATLAVVLMGVVGAGAFTKLVDGGFDDPDSESSRATEVIGARFDGETNLVLLVTADDGDIDAPAATERGRALAADLRAEPTLVNVIAYFDDGNPALRSTDGDQAVILAHVEGEELELAENVKAVIDEHTGTLDGGLTVRAGGGSAVGNDLSTQVNKDLLLAEAIAVPLILILLLFVFRSLVAALLPLLIGVVAILGTLAELSLLAEVTDVSITSVNLTTALGLGLGVDYALLMISRFREQLAAGVAVPEAVRHTMRTAGRTVAFSAATVAAALTALLVFPQAFLRSVGYAGIGVVLIAAVSALVLMPALFALLGHRINNGRLPWVRPEPATDRTPLWGRLARTVMRRPALTALPVLAVLLVAAAPLLGVTFGTADERVLPESAESRQVSTALQENFQGNDDTALHIVIDQPVGADELRGYAVELSGLGGVARVETSAGTYTAGAPAPTGPGNPALGQAEAQRVSVVSALVPKSPAAEALVADVRDVAPPAGSEPLVGGVDAALVDTKDSIAALLPLGAALMVGSTLVLLFLFTGSVVQPLRALALNLVSLAAALGIVTWIFQDGHLSSLLGFTPQPMDTSMIVMMFCVAFGLSMDYEVFVTSRIKELHDAGADPETAVVDGLGHTGRIVSAAAGLIAVSFFAFVTSQISFMQMFGLGTGLAILIDAVAIRGVLVPAAMRVLGRAAWYAPGPLRRLHDRFGLSEGGPTPPAPAAEPPADRLVRSGSGS
ncbi:MMPL family transporter [Streptomyces sp. DSM 44915]|uniref:MMPL family transporter n=1 Tax=Streptomyces chisholmiae TaxID=3075540 RepID=A0ABU2JL95_9ACTN|nr:MMPL family transporter [Streptomyces sp. DSM 44915]MDT0265687.1 MMPL family transporter [Streptomyces sp. DSM 44915]